MKIVKTNHDQTIYDSDTISIYTNEFEIDEYIEAAIYNFTISQIQRLYLNSEANYNIYIIKIYVLELIITIVKKASPNYTKCVIYINNQAIIKNITKSRSKYFFLFMH